jgi:superfamily II DNA or RNA helicase
MKTLRPYQREAIDGIKAALRTANSCVCVLPTGGGKTIVAAKLIQEWEYGNTLFLAHTQELINQSAEKIGIEIGIRPHVEMNVQGAEFGTLWDGDMVVVGSVQSMVSDRRLKKYSGNPFSLLIVDECHHATSASYTKVIEYFRELNENLKVVGITATPNRADKTALGLAFETVAYQREIGWMVQEGWLVPFKQLTVAVESLDLSGVQVKKKRGGGEADFSGEQLEEILCEERTLHGMATPIIEQLGDRQAIVFCEGVKHAHLMASILNRHEPGSAAAVDGTTDKNERKQILARFAAGELRRVVNCAVLTEGFDAPATSAVVIGRPTKSVNLYTQMVGRGLRPLPGVVEGFDNVADPAWERRMSIATSPKQDCVVMDFVGASRNGVVDCFDVLGGNYDAEIRQLVREHAPKNGPVSVTAEDLNLAQQLAKLRHAIRDRETIVARAQYTIEEADGYRTSPTGAVHTERRGGSTDGQVSALIKFGVSKETALGYSKSQAGAVLTSLMQSRCSVKQAQILKRYGIPTDGVNADRAKVIIDQIASNGWRMPAGGVA